MHKFYKVRLQAGGAVAQSQMYAKVKLKRELGGRYGITETNCCTIQRHQLRSTTFHRVYPKITSK